MKTYRINNHIENVLTLTDVHSGGVVAQCQHDGTDVMVMCVQDVARIVPPHSIVHWNGHTHITHNGQLWALSGLFIEHKHGDNTMRLYIVRDKRGYSIVRQQHAHGRGRFETVAIDHQWLAPAVLALSTLASSNEPKLWQDTNPSGPLSVKDFIEGEYMNLINDLNLSVASGNFLKAREGSRAIERLLKLM